MLFTGRAAIMLVRVRLFAMMAEQAGRATLQIELPAGSRAGALRGQEQLGRLRWPAGTLLAINQEYAAPETELKENDEVALIPPVSGG